MAKHSTRSTMIRLLSLSFLVLWLWPSPTSSRPYFTDRYDEDIRAAVKKFGADFPFWRAWKAQLYQESKLDPDAVSPVGARGLAQFMPGTWADISRQIGSAGADRRDARVSIMAGQYYMAQLRHAWRSPRPDLDRQHLAEASYNAGLGSLLKAQDRCGGAVLYSAIVPCLGDVTGPQFSHETTTYVTRIDEWWKMMEAVR